MIDNEWEENTGGAARSWRTRGPTCHPSREKEGVLISTAVTRLLGAPLTPGRAPDLKLYDLVLINTSAGKDSQAIADVVIERARRASVLDRVVFVHADLGEAEWPGTTELVREHAAHYGLPVHIVARTVDGRIQTILERVLQRGMWPDAARRWCTSDHKRGPIRKLMTKLTTELRESGTVVGRPVAILNTLGMRAQESPARRKRAPYRYDRSASNSRRHVDEWLPIHPWRTEQVWSRIRRAGTRHHWAYDAGMSRLSCRFCVLASRDDLVCSARLNPDLAAKYAAAETHTGHQFRHDLSIAEIITHAHQPPTQPAQYTLW